MQLPRSLLLLATAAVVLVMPASAQFKTGTLTVPIYVTATDEERRLVPNLEQEHFEVYDNGRPVPLTLFENKNTPITVVVMLDTSGSMTLILDRVKAAAEQFLIRMLPEDTGRVGAFSDKIQFHPQDAFTSDRDQLIRSLKELDFGYPTRLWDAVDESIRRLEPVPGRKVTLVFTDRSEEHTSELQSQSNIVCRLLLEK